VDFLDTNILVYAVRQRAEAAKKAAAARALIQPNVQTVSSHFDSCVVAAAKQLGCPTIYSEDLKAGQIYDRILDINPFQPL